MQNDRPVYIGKSVSLKARITSHYQSAKLDRKERAIQTDSDSIKFTITDNEFKALLLEAELIQLHQPTHNRVWKDDKSYLYIRITGDELPKIYPVRKTDIATFTPTDGRKKDKASYYGPFPSSRVVDGILKSIRRVIPFCMRSTIGKRSCFYSKIGLCTPCPSYIVNVGDEELQSELTKKYRKNIRKVIKILEGDISEITSDYYDEIKAFSDREDYESALKLRNRINRFERYISLHSFAKSDDFSYNQSDLAQSELLDMLIPHFNTLKSVSRIECYDASTLMGNNSTASMVVLNDGLIDKSQYRRFKIKNPRARSDFAMLEEAVRRRFKNKWPHPDLIVVDGGKPQVRKILNVIDKLETSIPVIGIAKNPDRLVIGVPYLPTIRPDASNPGFRLIQLIRDESHRFATTYSSRLRSI